MKRKRKITEITNQVRNKTRKTLVLDDGSVFGISEDVLLMTNLGIGDELSDEDIASILEKEDTSKVMYAALHLLEFRMRSISEMRQRLIQKQFEPEKVTPVIDKLIEMDYLNDEKFALAFARDKVKNRKIGPILLKKELGKHFLGQEIINSTIDTVYKEFSTDDFIANHIQKKIPDPGKVLMKDINRIQNFLQRKGFFWDQIREHLSILKEQITNNE